MKIGIVVILSGNIFHPKDLGDFFEGLDMDWRLSFWPFHNNGVLREDIHRDNIRKSISYSCYSERYKDVAWKEFDKWSNPIINSQEVDEDSWNAHNGKCCPDYFDFHEIRILNEFIGKYYNLTAEEKLVLAAKRAAMLGEWVADCDHLFIDITECLRLEPDETWKTINILLDVPQINRKTIFLYDWVPVLDFLGIKKRNEWNKKIQDLGKRYQIFHVNPEFIERFVGKKEDVGSFPSYLKRMINHYSETLKECILREINHVALKTT